MQKYIGLYATNDNQKFICWDKEKDKYYQIPLNGGPRSYSRNYDFCSNIKS